MNTKRIAIIGSFQRTDNYVLIQKIIALFKKVGLTVVSPTGALVTENREGFIVFESDNNMLTNEKIQHDTLEKIFSAHIVYVVNINGYVGKTTCYEIGRVLERKIPLYFYSYPKDLPLCVTEDFIVSPDELVKIIYNSAESLINFECSLCKNLKVCSGDSNAKT